MRFQPPELQVATDGIFADEAALFKAPAESLCNLIQSTSGPCIIALDAPWGSGKTTFLRFWRALYENSGEVVWYNAWENDYCDDVLVSLVEEIGSQLSEGEGGTKLEALKEKTVNVVKANLPFAVKLATAGLVDVSGISLEGLDSHLEGLAKKKLDAYMESKKGLEEFKRSLHDYISEKAQDKPVVVVVDELDRCRPDFAIRVLVTIKHVFGIDNLVFILGVDLDELSSSVNAVYGDKFSSRKYLTRFFNVRAALPVIQANGAISSLTRRMELDEMFTDNSRDRLWSRSSLVEFLETLADLYSLSVRDVQHVVSTLGVFCSSVGEGQLVLPHVVCWLAVLRHHEPALYKRIQSDQETGRSLVQEIDEQIEETSQLDEADIEC